MKIIMRLMAFSRDYWVWLLLSVACLLASTGFSLLIPYILRQAIDNITNHGPQGALAMAALGIVGATVLKGLVSYGNNQLGEMVSQKTAYDVRNALYSRLQSLSFAYHDKAQTGQLMSRATADVDAVRGLASRGLIALVQTILLFAGVAYLLVLLDWKLALMSLAFLPFISIRAVMVTNRLRPMWLKVQQLLGHVGTVLEENIAGVRVVKAFSLEKEESEKFSKAATDLYENEKDTDRQMASSMPLMIFLVSLPTALILWYGGRQVIAKELTIGGLTQFIFYVGMLAMPVRRLGYVIGTVTRAISAGQRIFEILDAESPVKEKTGAIELKSVTGEVSFQGVSFSYDSSADVLKNVSFTAKPGQTVALVGGSGSGKTTIASLIPRFYDVTSGSINIDGKDIRDVTLYSLRRNVGIVQQDIFLFSASIRDNIAYGNESATQEQVEDAARAAHMDEFIESLAEGYNTWVGERGITLSGGEKQRLAIARTLLTNPAVLIFDDSTSSVDTETEHYIRLSMNRLIKGRTTFIITHRLPIIRNADVILVMKDGELVEQGRHEDLMKKSGIYKQMYDAQFVEGVLD